MSWSDDTRCLYCDGRLPLYRKITHGQFCSNAHRKSYWEDQEKLAVERLSQTHNSLQAFRLAVTAEPFRDAEPELEHLHVTPGENGEPGFGTLVPQAWISPAAILPGMLAGDPLEYEMFTLPRRPSHTALIEMRLAPVAELIRGWANFSACEWSGRLTRGEVAPFISAVRTHNPKLGLSPINVEPVKIVSAEAPAVGDRIEIPLFFHDCAGADSTIEALGPAMAPVTELPFDIPAQVSDAMLLLLDALSPCPDRLLQLENVVSRAGGPWPLRKEDSESAVMLPQTMILRGDNIAEFTVGETKPSDGALLGISVECAKSGQHIRLTEPQALDARPERLVTQLSVATSAAEMSLPYASSQLSFPRSNKYAAPGADLEPFSAEARAVGLPVFRGSMTPLRGVPDAFTSLIGLAYGKNAPLCGAATASLRPIHFFPQHPTPAPLIPQSRLMPIEFKADPLPMPTSAGLEFPIAPPVPAARQHPPVWSHAVDFWKNAPRDLKMLAFAIPVLLALAFHPSLPKVSLAAPQIPTTAPSEFRKVINDQWSNVRQSVLDRAAIALDEDFRQGLDDWASPGGSTTSWSFDQTGFVRPGPLALYRPTVGLTDYQVQFLGLIDKKAISWVVRAADFDNYYVIKMVVLKPGPVPTLGIIRYAVIHGKARNRVDTPVQISARADMLYRVLVDVHGDEFTVGVQGQVIDSWSEPRLPRGGVGFFSARGEESRVRWVQVTHQYDMLGRLCAYLAPYNIPSTNGSWQP